MAALNVRESGLNPQIAAEKPPPRVVSLVPSLTQSLIDLECDDTLVGVTQYCPRPAGETQAENIGGTHAVDLDKIVTLQPDLILANQEENDRADIEALEEAGLDVWVSFPKSVQDAIETLWLIARVFRVVKEAARKIVLIERSLEWVQRGASQIDARSVFVPIWQAEAPDPGIYWMTFNHDTYCDSVLTACGGCNVFKHRNRRYPLEAEFVRDFPAEQAGERDTRYPRVGPEEVLETSPEIILLPSEPFAFSVEDQRRIADLLRASPAVKNDKIYRIDGRWLSWHGTTLSHALAGLPAYLE